MLKTQHTYCRTHGFSEFQYSVEGVSYFLGESRILSCILQKHLFLWMSSAKISHVNVYNVIWSLNTHDYKLAYSVSCSFNSVNTNCKLHCYNCIITLIWNIIVFIIIIIIILFFYYYYYHYHYYYYLKRTKNSLSYYRYSIENKSCHTFIILNHFIVVWCRCKVYRYLGGSFTL